MSDSEDDWEKEADKLQQNDGLVEEDQWEGEDEDDAVDAWDADPVDKPKKKVEVNNPKKLKAKQLEKQQELLELEQKRKEANMTEEQKIAKFLAEKKKIQESNDGLIDDLFGEAEFGGEEEEDTPAVDGFDRDRVKAQANDDLFGGGSDVDEDGEEKEKKKEDNMKTFSVKTEKEVEEFAGFVVEKIKKAPGKRLIMKFMKEMLKKGTEDFLMDDVKVIQKQLTQIYNLKRVEHNQKKQKKTKKKTGYKGRTKADLFDDMGSADYGDDFF